MELKFERLNHDNYRLTWAFRVNPSSCANPDYFSEYLRFTALNDWQKGIGTTHLIIEEDQGQEKILGFVTLRASSYTVETPEAKLGNPAIEIFELAVADGAEKQSIGSTLVKYALIIASKLRASIGVRYVLLCATESAVGFYEKLGFGRVRQYGDIPRDETNQNCVPMHLELPELHTN